MAKAAILDVLESTIGRYVQNLDAQSLNVAVWAGKIELNALRLDVDSVNRQLKRKALKAPNLALPFRVVEGSFRSLRVDVPWARLTSQPVVLRAAGLDVLIEPYDHLAPIANQKDSVGCNTEELPSAQKKKKGNKRKEKKDERQNSLIFAEEGRQRGIAMRALAEIGDDDDSVEGENKREESSSGFRARLVRRIIENLQLQVEGVQLKIRGEGCDAGIILESFSIATTDKEGNKTFVNRSSNSKNVMKSFLYKFVELKGLGIYCNEDTNYSRTAMSHLSRSTERSPTSFKTPSYQKRAFILSPLSFEAKLRQSDCIQCIDFPKYLLSAQLPNVAIVLSRTQLELIHNITLSLSTKQHSSFLLFPEYRPSTPIQKGNAKLWWKYAVRCIGRLNRRRSWSEFFIAYRKRKEFIPLYKRMAHHLSCSWLSPLTVEEKIVMDRVEDDKTISVEGIMNWRNIADAQVKIEKKKYLATVRKSTRLRPSSRKSSYLSSLFGSNKAKNDFDGNSELEEGAEAGEPPITLSVDEMKELESVTSDVPLKENELSNDSILCDVKFKLGSFKVDLISFNSQPIAFFKMGTVLSSFMANADGSFSADFSVSSLNVQDRITCRSLFPLVVRSLQSSDDLQSKFTHAFEFKLKKANNGDQELMAKMVSFEIVLSSLFVTEMKSFITFNQDSRSQYQLPCNPHLEETIGGADLFYDAPGSSEIPCSSDTIDNFMFKTKRSTKVSEQLSSAIVDAWVDKVDKKTSWRVDLEIHAPILVVPNSCVDPMATVLVVDLGNFCFTFGGAETSNDVQMWFDERPIIGQLDKTIDNCSLKMENLSFLIGKAGDKDWINSKVSSGKSLVLSEAIIEPITLSLDVGVENGRSSQVVARKCMFGVLPAINLNLSCSQIARILSVVTTWTNVIDSMMTDNGLLISEPEIIQESDENKNPIEKLKQRPTLPSSNKPTEIEHQLDKHQITLDRLHFSIALQKLSVKITNEEGDSLEAHLVSARTSITQRNNDSSAIRVQMGWFWILDRLKHVRKQRLVAHSFLPRSASSFAESDRYDIMEELEKQGIFHCSNAPRGSLADVNIMKSSSFDSSSSITEKSVITSQSNFTQVTNIDAKFSTLFIHWNPYAIRNLLAFKDNVTSFIERVVTLPISRSSVSSSRGYNNKNEPSPTMEKSVIGVTESKSLLIVNAEMEAVELCLNSAKDDLPLFEVTMADSKVKLHLSTDNDQGQSLLAYICIGDFRLEIPPNGILLKDYCTLLGLSPNHTTSLLSIEYGKGPVAVQSCDLKDVIKEKTVSFMKVGLSPMRYVHIQAQILTLVEYVTEGVLGAMTARVASSAAQAARGLTEAVAGEQVFHVIASGFDLVLPQAAYSQNHFVLHSGNLSIKFKSFPRPGHAEAILRLEEVSMVCNREETVIETPIRMIIDVDLAPNDAPTEDEKAMRVTVSFSRATFLLTHHQYSQIRNTLEQNIGQLNSFLREDAETNIESTDGHNESVILSGQPRRTHSGAEEILIQKRIYMNFYFEHICLELCNAGITDPIISMAAVETSISLQLLPDEQETRAKATLHDLVCDDRRLVTLNQHFRQIIRQVDLENDVSVDRDVFQLSYVKCVKDNFVTFDVTVGSPQVVIIPGVISDLLTFISEDDSLPGEVNKIIPNAKGIKVEVMQNVENLENVEFHISDPTLNKFKTSVLKFKISDIRIVLIDVMDCNQKTSTISFSSPVGSAETFVMKGEAEGVIKLVNDIMTNETSEKNFELHGENIEFYTAEGQELKSPVQVLEPLKFSAFVSSRIKNEILVVDSSFVTLSNLEMTMSMQNIAFLMAVWSSMHEAFTKETAINKSEEIATSLTKLSDTETAAIEKLAFDLEKNDVTESEASARSEVSSHCISTVDDQSVSTKQPEKCNISFKMTLPHTAVTIVNDLQGLDEALFKMIVTSCVSGMDLSFEGHKASNSSFRFYVNTCLQSDFFDPRSNLWQPLLVEPWELHLKGSRGKSSRYKSPRLATNVDIESHPCKISFSEQFIIGLGAAKSMWSVFSGATKKANSMIDRLCKDTSTASSISSNNLSSMKNRASKLSRCLVTALPYGIENHCGMNVEFEVGGKRDCVDNCSTQFFRFDLPRRNGVGGSRAYGQDCDQCKLVKLYVGKRIICLEDVDVELNQPKRVHNLGSGQYIFSDVTKIGHATIIHIRSFIDVRNETTLDFQVSFSSHNDVKQVGLCRGKNYKHMSTSKRNRAKLKSISGFGVPVPFLQKAFHSNSSSQKRITLIISPTLNRCDLRGEIELPSLQEMMKHDSLKVFDLPCVSFINQNLTPGESHSHVYCKKMVLRVSCKTTIVGGSHPFLEFLLQPRTILQNNMFINLEIRTPMPHTFSKSSDRESGFCEGVETHQLQPFEIIEIFCPDSSISVSVKCADHPIGGTRTGWNTYGWIEIPLDKKNGLKKKIQSTFPFVDRSDTELQGDGSEFFVAEASSYLDDPQSRSSNEARSCELPSSQNTGSALTHQDLRRVLFHVDNVGVDHTGEILFIQFTPPQERTAEFGSFAEHRNQSLAKSCNPFSAFSSSFHNRRITLLPGKDVPISLQQLTMERTTGIRNSRPFRIEDISLCDGGIDSTPILLDYIGHSVQYYAYRRLSDVNQWELHIIPEFVVFNGGDRPVRIIQPQGNEFILEAGKMTPVRRLDKKRGLILMLDFLSITSCTAPVRVDELGMKVCVVNSSESGFAVGSVAIQTILGGKDSRFVVKLGKLNVGSSVVSKSEVFANDFLRFRVRWTQLEVTLRDTSHFENEIILAQNAMSQRNYSKVAHIVFERFTIDYQRLFKDEEISKMRDTLKNTSRSQFAMLVHNICIIDCTPPKEKTVLDSSSIKTNFIDLCVRTRGSSGLGLINVDLFDLKIAHDGTKSEEIVVKTSEAFVWRLLDIVSRTQQATVELSGVDLEIEWDEESGDFTVYTIDLPKDDRTDFDDDGTYRPPRSDNLYAVRTACISPVTCRVSFKRQIQASRYQSVQNVRGAKLVNYFTKRLKFTIDNALLNFAGYKGGNIKGELGFVLQVFKAFYSSQMKRKLLILVSATSLDDWKHLAARDVGNENYVEGDILRITGNLAGKSAGFVLKKVGQGIGQGLTSGTSRIGDGIQSATEVLGVGPVGAGVNNLVSGIGGGVADTVEGVGVGTSTIVKSAGKGVGQVIGGVSGGLLLAAKGIGKGVKDGDGKALASGLGDGVVSIGSGIVDGAESVVTGTAQGFFSVGKGLFTGLQTVGKGVGKIVTGEDPKQQRKLKEKGSRRRR